MTDFQDTIYRRMIAMIAVQRLSDRSHDEPDIVESIIDEYYETLQEGTEEYSTWHYHLEEQKKHRTGYIGNLREAIEYSISLVDAKLWVKQLTKTELATLRRVALTYNPAASDQSRKLFGLSNHPIYNSDEFTEKIDLDVFNGTQFVNFDFDVMEASRRRDDRPAHVEVVLSSWKGVSIGAEHYYARLNCYNIQHEIKVVESPSKRFNEGTFYGIGGHGDQLKPAFLRLREIQVRRPLTKTDLKETRNRGNKDRYEGYEIGNPIDGFWSEADAIRWAKKEFERIFDSSKVTLTIDE